MAGDGWGTQVAISIIIIIIIIITILYGHHKLVLHPKHALPIWGCSN
jgi:hypothetical protein